MRPYVLLWRGEPLQRVQGRRKQQRIFGTLRIKGEIGQGPNGGGPRDREHGTGGEGDVNGSEWTKQREMALRRQEEYVIHTPVLFPVRENISNMSDPYLLSEAFFFCC